MKNFIFKDDLVIQVLYALFSITVFIIGMAMLWFLIIYMPQNSFSNIQKAFTYVLVPIFAPVAFYYSYLCLGVAICSPDSKWAKKGFSLDSAPDLEAMVVASIFYVLAIIVTIILRALGINGYKGKHYSSIIFKAKN